MIAEHSPMTTPYELPRPVVAYSDARGAAHLGVFIENSDNYACTNTHDPRWRVDRPDTNITELETIADILALICAIAYRTGLPRLLFVDNAALASCLINGTGDASIARGIMTMFWRLSARRSVFVCSEWSPTNLQIADPPSRCCGASRVNNILEASTPVVPIPELSISILASEKSVSDALLNTPKISNPSGVMFTGPSLHCAL